MGHLEPGFLPDYPKWRTVVGLLDAPRVDASAVASATVVAADRRLKGLKGDPSLTYCFWLLTRLASAAQTDDFVGGLAQLGIPVTSSDAALSVIARVADRVRTELVQFPGSSHYAELASLALRRALTETVGVEGRSLFESNLVDLERAFRRHSTAVQFGEQAVRFFGDFYARTLRYYVEKEVANRIGMGGGLATTGDATAFIESLDRHARQSARVVEAFAADWYSLHHFTAEGTISREEVQGFVAHALDKLRGVLRDGAP